MAKMIKGAWQNGAAYFPHKKVLAQGPTKAQRSNGRGHVAGFSDSDAIAASHARHVLLWTFIVLVDQLDEGILKPFQKSLSQTRIHFCQAVCPHYFRWYPSSLLWSHALLDGTDIDKASPQTNWGLLR